MKLAMSTLFGGIREIKIINGYTYWVMEDGTLKKMPEYLQYDLPLSLLVEVR